MIKSFTLSAIIVLSFFSSFIFGNDPHKIKENSINNNSTIVLPWIKNGGQYDNKVAFATKTRVADIAVLKNGNINYFVNIVSGEKFSFTETILNKKETNHSITGKDISGTKFNFIKSGKERNVSDVPSFNTVNYGEIYDGISMNIDIRDNNIEKVIKIKPYSDPNLIQFQLTGVEEMCENEEGELQLEIKNQIISFTKPVAWQMINGKKVDVPVKYNIKEDLVYGFELGKYDSQYNLYIDPLLSSSFIGGSQFDFAEKVLVGKNGHVYIGGVTDSPDIPVTGGTYDETYNDSTDIFVAIFNSDLSVLEVCTYIGGSDMDILNDMKLDTADNVYFVGRTESKDYPTTTNAFDTIFNGLGIAGYGDMMISCLNSKLNELKYSTFVGGDRDDAAITFDFDRDYNLVITGTSGTGIPSIGPQLYAGTKDFVFFKMNSDLSNMLSSNSIQTDSITVPVDIVVDAQSVFITGTTTDPAFPATVGAFSDTLAGKADVFVMRLSADLSNIEASTFLGGKQLETPACIILDSFGNVYLSGATNSPRFPTTPNAYDTVLANQLMVNEDAFLCIMDYDLSSLGSSTFLGGSNIDIAGEISLDTAFNVYLSGFTYSPDFPVFCNSYDDSYNGGADCFLAKFSPKLENLISSTYFGGYDNDFCYSIAQDTAGNIYSTGFTNSIDFPVYLGYDSYYNGDGGDGFVLKMTPDFNKPYPCCSEILEPAPYSGDLPLDFKIVWGEARGATGYYFSAGTRSDTFDIVSHLDMRDTTRYILHGLNCGDTIFVEINPYNDYGINKNCEMVWFTTHEPFYKEDNTSICEGDSVEWQDSFYMDAGIYIENYTDVYGCDSTYTLILDVNPNFYEYEESEICEGDSYFWQGDYYKNSGYYAKNYSTVNGCDSVFELNLTVFPSYLIPEEATICKGDTFEWQDYILTSGGTYYAEYETMNGCDSSYILNLTILPSYEIYDTASVCEGDYYDWQGESYSLPGDYQKSYQTIDGCDSIYYLRLDLNANYHIEEDAEMCSGDTLAWQGMLLDSSGTYYASYTSIDGCDSTYQLILTVLPAFYLEEDAEMCSGDTLAWQGMLLDSTGTYYATYTSIDDCDSTYQLNLTVLPAYHIEEDAEICSGDTLEWQSMLLDSTGTYYISYTSIDGCDSTFQLNLAVMPNYYFEEEAMICEGDTLEWQGMNIDSTGTYYAEYQTKSGCDSIYQIYVEEVIIDNTVTQLGDTLFAVYDSTATYQWVTCPNMDTISGANESIYITTESGEYAVIIDKEGCSKTSECVSVVNSGIENPDKFEVRIFPNPVYNQYLTVSIDNYEKVKTLDICDLSGRTLKTFDKIKRINKIDVNGLVHGLYFVRIHTKDRIINKKVIILTE